MATIPSIPPYDPNRRKPSDPASRYPSPPPTVQTPHSSRFDTSLVIPPFNPNNASRRQHQTPQPQGRPSSAGYGQQYPSNQYTPQQQQYPSPPPSAGGAGAGRGMRASVGYMPISTSTNSFPMGSGSPGTPGTMYVPPPMPKQKVYFGPYILLQTLGEGEFGKVKLGLHRDRWGEEVAIKLIKKGSVDTQQRHDKVKREIDVLKAVRHPYIVRLYDVIETEKYIGIVLEYASGGELFDHILAHRYLKDRDASRFFAQLISGVQYLHAKGIVHRDLKLENLLLERGSLRITDFGFANRFHDARTDLMATSCGSPCYAAPELVVQDGKYIGTAVDVWSCGVILYAMLAGYLPYDDDPANPDGDNINLLYKYIINTKLIFPDWIGDDARELLLMMLVPDPLRRCTLNDVCGHPWLRRHAATFMRTVPELEAAAQEAEQARRKALEVQRQYYIAQQQAALQHQQAMLSQSHPLPPQHQQHAVPLTQHIPAHMTRSATQQAEAISLSAARHRSAVVVPVASGTMSASQYRPSPIEATFLPPPSVPEEGAYVQPPPTVIQHYQSPASHAMVPSFSAPPDPPATNEDQIMAEGEKRGESRRRQEPTVSPPSTTTTRTRRTSTRSSTGNSTSGIVLASSSSSGGASDSEQRRKKAHRATVQVEYDGGGKSKPARPVVTIPEPSPTASTSTSSSAVASTSESPFVVPLTSMVGEKELPKVEQEDVVMMPVDQVDPPSVPPKQAEAISIDLPTTLPLAPARPPTPPLVPLHLPSTPPQSPRSAAVLDDSTPKNATPQKRKSTGSPAATRSSSAALPPLPTTTAPIEEDYMSTPKAVQSRELSPPPEPVPPIEPLPIVAPIGTPVLPEKPAPIEISPVVSTGPRSPSIASSVSTTNKHKKGTLSTDRFSIRSLLGSSSTSLERSSGAKSGREKEMERLRVQQQEKEAKEKAAIAAAAAKQRPQFVQQQPQALDEVTNGRRKSRRQKALSLQPFRPSQSGKVTKALQADSSALPAREGPRTRSSTAAQAPPPPISKDMPPPLSLSAQKATGSVASRHTLAASTASQESSAPSTRAKAVMDWFRRRGSSKTVEPAPFQPDFDGRRRSTRPSTAAARADESREGSTTPKQQQPSNIRNPSVVVTSSAQEEVAPDEPSIPSSRSASGAQSDLSRFSQLTTSTAATSVLAPTPPTPVVAAQVPPVVVQPAAFDPTKLRTHTGALDKHAVTSRNPAVVIQDVRNVLWEMGIDMTMDGDYKIKCVRRSRKKSLATTGLGLSTLSGSTQSNGSSVGPANSAGLDRRTGLPQSPSIASQLTSSPSSGFRAFFGRRNSYTPGTPSLTGSSPAPPASPNPSAGHDDLDVLLSPLAPSTAQFGQAHGSQPMPTFGDKATTDAGDEVRFSIEVTRVRHLQGLYHVDLRRLKGSPWTVKWLHGQLFDKLKLDAN